MATSNGGCADAQNPVRQAPPGMQRALPPKPRAAGPSGITEAAGEAPYFCEGRCCGFSKRQKRGLRDKARREITDTLSPCPALQ